MCMCMAVVDILQCAISRNNLVAYLLYFELTVNMTSFILYYQSPYLFNTAISTNTFF